MNAFFIRWRSAVLAFSSMVSMAASASNQFPGDDRNLVYTGRVDSSVAGAPSLSWPGSSVAGIFAGRNLSVVLDDQFGNNFFNVFIDGQLAQPEVLHALKGRATYSLAKGLADGDHAFLITKRTEGEDGRTAIRSFELDAGRRFLPPAPRPARRIEFIGDSITSGMGNEAPDDGPDNLPRDKNNFLAYDAIVARALDAELHVISQSGIGVMVSWVPFTMPQFFGQLDAVGKNDSRWDFARWTPQVVVINLFQNDRWLIEREHRLSPAPTDRQRVQAYVDFVASVRKAYPDAFILCTLGDMDATEAGSPWPGYVRTAVQELKRAHADQKIDTFFFEYSGFGAHPRLRHHRAMADKLTAFIRARMHWDQDPVPTGPAR